MAGLVAYLDVRAGLRGQVQDRGKVGTCPAAGPVPRGPRGHPDRAGQLRLLPGGQCRDVRGGERRGEAGDQRDRGQRDREECQREPQAERVAAGPETRQAA